MTLPSTSVFSLGPDENTPDWAISDAGNTEGYWIDGLEGMEAVALQVRFDPGTGGSGGVTFLLQSSLDGGNTAFDVALLSFDAASRAVILHIRPVTTGVVLPGSGGNDAAGDPETEGVIAPILGDRLRARLNVAGTYAGATLSARAMPT